MTRNPNFFGSPNGIDSKDYYPLINGDGGVTDSPVDVLGISLESPQFDTTDAVEYYTVVLRNGYVVPARSVKRAAQKIGVTGTLGLPSTIYTPFHKAVDLYQGKLSALMMRYLTDDVKLQHALIINNLTLGAITPSDSLVTNKQDTNIIEFTSEFSADDMFTLFNLSHERVYDAAGSVAYHSISFEEDGILSEGAVPSAKFVVAGGDGTAVPEILSTTDRMGSTSTISGVGAAGDVVLTYRVFGNTHFAFYSNPADWTNVAAAVGGMVSFDSGTSWKAVTGITAAILDIIQVGNLYVAVGQQPQSATAAAAVYLSSDGGSSFSAVSSSAIPSNSALTAATYDGSRIYISGDGGIVLKGTVSGGSLTLSDISANLAGSPPDLKAIHALAEDEILVGGASGYLARTRDGGTTFEQVSFTSTSAVSAISGDVYRQVIAAGAKLYEASILTDNAFEEVALENGVTLSGNITDIADGPTNGLNYYALVTDAGEVVYCKPYYNGA